MPFMDKTGCKAVMYHYVRDWSHLLPSLKYLHIEDFKKQLDFFEQEYWFVSKEDWNNFVTNKTAPPNGVVLTFDDGLIDHHNFVLPILKERKLWWIFFVCSGPLEERRLLNVHKIHYLLAKYNSKDVYDSLIQINKELEINLSLFDLHNVEAYGAQIMDEYSLAVKKINYLPNRDIQNRLLEGLMSKFHEYDEVVWDNFYMSVEQIKRIGDAWSIIWGHSKSHFLLWNIDSDGLDEEVVKSTMILNQLIQINIDCFCYPFWGVNSYNDNVKSKLREMNLVYSFCVDPRDVTRDDVVENIYWLPRYDCSMFRYGKVRL
jgi:Polysaccharide deacetylase